MNHAEMIFPLFARPGPKITWIMIGYLYDKRCYGYEINVLTLSMWALKTDDCTVIQSIVTVSGRINHWLNSIRVNVYDKCTTQVLDEDEVRNGELHSCIGHLVWASNVIYISAY